MSESDEYNNILTSVKKLIGPSVEYDYFDPDLLIHINTFFEVLTQCGVGPQEGFHVDENSTWDEFLTEGKLLHMAKDYIQLRTRLIFDPPSSSFVIDLLKKNAEELEWRMYIAAEELKRGIL